MIWNNYHWLYLTNTLWVGLFTKSKLRLDQIKKILESGAFWEVPNESNHDSSPGMELLGSSKSPLLLSVATRLLVFPASIVSSQCYWIPGEKVIGINQGEMPRGRLSLPRFSNFSWINAAWNVANLWWFFRVLEKLIVTVFTSVLVAFCGEMVLSGSFQNSQLCTHFL